MERFIQGTIAKITTVRKFFDNKIDKEVAKAEKRFGDAFNKEEFVSTNQRVLGYQEKIDSTLSRMAKSLEKEEVSGSAWNV